MRRRRRFSVASDIVMDGGHKEFGLWGMTRREASKAFADQCKKLRNDEHANRRVTKASVVMCEHHPAGHLAIVNSFFWPPA